MPKADMYYTHMEVRRLMNIRWKRGPVSLTVVLVEFRFGASVDWWHFVAIRLGRHLYQSSSDPDRRA